MKRYIRIISVIGLLAAFCANSHAGDKTAVINDTQEWAQWRGPNRDGKVKGTTWPARLNSASLEKLWRIPVNPSYSGPIVTETTVYTTETRNKETEAVIAVDRLTGVEKWRAEWQGAMKVPFFAAANGSWIRSTPAYDGEYLYVAGMRDVLVCLDAENGSERWRVDFVEQLDTPVPAFGFVSSPLLDAHAVYVQAGAALVKINKQNGEIIWRTMKDDGGMNGSAFSSPIFATIHDEVQLVVQTRERLAGVEPETGDVLWSRKVPAYRGMNILTPIVLGNDIFTSTYRVGSWLFSVSADGDKKKVKQIWNNNAMGYMSSPVVIDGFVYLHLQNGRFTCIDLTTGKRTWTSKPFGKYCSMVAQDNRILALVNDGELLLIEADSKEFRLIVRLQVSESDTWAHLAMAGDELFIRELDALTAFRWSDGSSR